MSPYTTRYNLWHHILLKYNLWHHKLPRYNSCYHILRRTNDFEVLCLFVALRKLALVPIGWVFMGISYSKKEFICNGPWKPND